MLLLMGHYPICEAGPKRLTVDGKVDNWHTKQAELAVAEANLKAMGGGPRDAYIKQQTIDFINDRRIELAGG